MFAKLRPKPPPIKQHRVQRWFQRATGLGSSSTLNEFADRNASSQSVPNRQDVGTHEAPPYNAGVHQQNQWQEPHPSQAPTTSQREGTKHMGDHSAHGSEIERKPIAIDYVPPAAQTNSIKGVQPQSSGSPSKIINRKDTIRHNKQPPTTPKNEPNSEHSVHSNGVPTREGSLSRPAHVDSHPKRSANQSDRASETSPSMKQTPLYQHDAANAVKLSATTPELGPRPLPSSPLPSLSQVALSGSKADQQELYDQSIRNVLGLIPDTPSSSAIISPPNTGSFPSQNKYISVISPTLTSLPSSTDSRPREPPLSDQSVREQNHSSTSPRPPIHDQNLVPNHHKGSAGDYSEKGREAERGLTPAPIFQSLTPAVNDILPKTQTGTLKSNNQYIDTTEVSPDDFVVLVMGETGAGKSTFIETLSGRTDVGVSHGLASGTTAVRAFPTKEYIAGKRLVLVDTPGTGSADLSDADVLVMLARWLLESYRKKVIPIGVLLLWGIDAPLSITYRSQLILFRQICGDGFLRNVALVTAMWDQGRQTLDEKCEKTLQEDARFWKPMMMCGARAARFHNTKKSARDVVALLANVQPTVLLLQRQLAIEGRKVEGTSAGKLVWLPEEAEIHQRLANSKQESIRTDPSSQDDAVINIAVIGPTGSGKSSFINCATRGVGRDIGHSLRSHTTKIVTSRTKHPTTEQPVIFLDTPGFDNTDTDMRDAQILELIREWLESSYAGDMKLSGILYLHDISENRLNHTALKNLRMFQTLCGKDALQKVVLLTSFWDEVEGDVGPSREKELTKSFWRNMIQNQSQVARFNQSFESAWAAVDLLLGREKRPALLLQKELVDEHKDLPEMQAGAALLNTLEKLLVQQQIAMKNLVEERKHENDPRYIKELEQEVVDLEKKIGTTVEQMQSLKVPLPKLVRRKLRTMGNIIKGFGSSLSSSSLDRR